MFRRNIDSGILILTAVARRAKVTVGELRLSRVRDITAWRMIAIYLLRETGKTTIHIAEIIGRDPSTVHHAYHKIKKLRTKPFFIALCNEIESDIDEAAKLHVLNGYFHQRIPPEVYAEALSSWD